MVIYQQKHEENLQLVGGFGFVYMAVRLVFQFGTMSVNALTSSTITRDSSSNCCWWVSYLVNKLEEDTQMSTSATMPNFLSLSSSNAYYYMWGSANLSASSKYWQDPQRRFPSYPSVRLWKAFPLMTHFWKLGGEWLFRGGWADSTAFTYVQSSPNWAARLSSGFDVDLRSGQKLPQSRQLPGLALLAACDRLEGWGTRPLL